METIEPNQICPVCGYALDFLPWVEKSAADEMCPCCGIQFGYDDSAGGDVNLRPAMYVRWRENWIRNGMNWSSKSIEPPSGWNAEEQLRKIQIT